MFIVFECSVQTTQLRKIPTTRCRRRCLRPLVRAVWMFFPSLNDSQRLFLSALMFASLQAPPHSHAFSSIVFGLCVCVCECAKMTSTHYVQIMLKYSYYRFICSHLNAIIQSFLHNLFVWMCFEYVVLNVLGVLVKAYTHTHAKYAAILAFSHFGWTFFFVHDVSITNATNVVDTHE